MNILKKEEGSTNPKLEKLNGSDTECLKSSNEKIIDLLTKAKIEKFDKISKNSKNITLNSREKSNEDDEDSYDDNDDDNLKIEKKSIDIIKTTAAEVLNQPKLEPKEKKNEEKKVENEEEKINKENI